MGNDFKLDTSLSKLNLIKDYDFDQIALFDLKFTLSFDDDDLTKLIFIVFNNDFFREKNNHFLEYRISSSSKISRNTNKKIKMSKFYYTSFEIKKDKDIIAFTIKGVHNLNVDIDSILKNILNSIKYSHDDLKKVISYDKRKNHNIDLVITKYSVEFIENSKYEIENHTYFHLKSVS